MDGDASSSVIALEEMMATADLEQRETLPLQKANHLRAGDAR